MIRIKWWNSEKSLKDNGTYERKKDSDKREQEGKIIRHFLVPWESGKHLQGLDWFRGENIWTPGKFVK